MRLRKRQKGFIKAIVLIVIALIALKYFNINFKDIVNSSFVQNLWSIIKQLASLLWQAITLTIDFLKTVAEKIKAFLGK